jgi:coenzyme F420 hydrogenase subunit beta
MNQAKDISLQSKSGLKNVIEGGYCIGCGACAVKDDQHQIIENDIGMYQAKLGSEDNEFTSQVCPFASDKDENYIGEKLYSKDSSFDERVGFYKEIYTGYVAEESYRKKGSSGGLVTWVLTELLRLGEIDAVVHVGETGKVGDLFEYRISETVEEIQSNSKSRYYPVHFDKVIAQIRTSNMRVAFVGVPCFVKAMRLLILSDPEIATKGKFCIAIFCGHVKT